MLNGRSKIKGHIDAHDYEYNIYPSMDSSLILGTATFCSGRIYYPHHSFDTAGSYWIHVQGEWFELVVAKSKPEAVGSVGQLLSVPIPSKWQHLPSGRLGKKPSKDTEICIPTKRGEQCFISTGFVTSDLEIKHNAPTERADCSSPYINPANGRVVGFHMWGSKLGNGGYFPGHNTDGYEITPGIENEEDDVSEILVESDDEDEEEDESLTFQ
jgi:hypothetical protein